MLERAYSTFEVKSIDEERRIIIGIASTPELDRGGDEMDPRGAKFKLPMPFKWEHKNAIGEVFAATVTSAGIEIQASIVKVDEPGLLKDQVDYAWQSIKFKLARGLSIGWNPIKAIRNAAGGLKVSTWDWLETSAVAIPMNASSTIQLIKSLDVGLAATGTEDSREITQPGATGTSRVVRLTAKGRSMKKTYTEQIASFEATRQAKSARMDEIMDTAADSGATLDESQKEEHDTLAGEVKEVDAHLLRLKESETRSKAAALPVNGSDPDKASASRGGVITVKANVPAGTAFTRYAMALAASRGSRLEAVEYAKRWEDSTPEVVKVLKAAVTAGTTTDSDWAAPLVVYQNMANEFVELLRPATIIGRIPGLRRVPFNISMPTQTQGATANWVGQGKPKPVSELKFGQLTLGMAKAAGIVVLSEELVRSSNPSAEAIVRSDLIATIGQFLDRQFVDPTVAAVANVSPASITNGVTPINASGTTYAALTVDVKALIAQFTSVNMSVAGAVWLMTETQAQSLSMMLNALGQRSVPEISMAGGTLFGLPVVTSENIPAEPGSPAGGRIILVKASEILLADDGGVTLDVSREASLQMDSAPTDPPVAATVMVSLWQLNLVGLRAERFINWVRRQAGAVGYINGANYA